MPKSQPLDGDDSLASTNKLLRVIVALMLRPRDEASASLKQQIEVLHDLDLRPTEIAAILRKKPSHINKELSGIRKQRKPGE